MASPHPNILLFVSSVISVPPQATHMSERTFCLFSSQERWFCFHLSAQIPKGDRQKGGVGRNNILTVCNNKKNDRSHRQRSEEPPCFPCTMIDEREWMTDQAADRLHAEQTVHSLVPLGPPSFDEYACSCYISPVLFLNS